jgi:energy-converting hydrogenase Eha subunit C
MHVAMYVFAGLHHRRRPSHKIHGFRVLRQVSTGFIIVFININYTDVALY